MGHGIGKGEEIMILLQKLEIIQDTQNTTPVFYNGI